ncbi:aldehyde dehydrogenase [Cyclospora cayetanensis]|uniref:Aldehyde dehydrogenase n=1 Tax=Cyclospora cayetanensis TaxID=88456 RepID=A0A1D3D198_9EIME|nr:aldehyde dehydrogenase [Cyclospora cayetanensis]
MFDSASSNNSLTSTLETRLFIDGEFREPRGERTWKLKNPATEEDICEIKEASKADVEDAVRTANRAFSSWSLQTAARTRGALLMSLADLLEKELDSMAALECLNVGKPFECARSDMHTCVANLRYYGGWADKIRGGAYIPVLDNEKISCHTRREPVGVVAAIVPWNFPLMLMVLKAAPALACGCTVVVKSSEKSPLTALAFCKLVQRAGLPPGVLNVLNGWGDTVGAALIRNPNVDKVSFTGSSHVGRLVAEECAATVKRVTLELGGKSPLVVLNDANIKNACEATWKGLFNNSGQCCVACSRVLVQSGVYDEFVDSLKKCVSEKAKLCCPRDPSCTQGPIVDEKQLKMVMNYIEEGKKQGAICVMGGKRKEGKGFWVLPTIFTGVTDDMKICKEEIFGPVVCVSKFDTIEEAVERANNTLYGLGAGVFTSSIPLANYFVSRLQAGTIWVNTYLSGDVGIPFGGYKASGYGREGGEEGLIPYLEIKTVVMNIEL